MATTACPTWEATTTCPKTPAVPWPAQAPASPWPTKPLPRLTRWSLSKANHGSRPARLRIILLQMVASRRPATKRVRQLCHLATALQLKYHRRGLAVRVRQRCRFRRLQIRQGSLPHRARAPRPAREIFAMSLRIARHIHALAITSRHSRRFERPINREGPWSQPLPKTWPPPPASVRLLPSLCPTSSRPHHPGRTFKPQKLKHSFTKPWASQARRRT
mmetsp:Transcript_20651/g.65908  ORF Transcript_20651/g.65908 Transcript_20651/m.65908 type:complete len:218 (+) Transcript_20651:447-1100(+)